jgi:hypothetical protein
MIGGPMGFREPIKKAIASYIAIHGSKADCGPLKAAIRKALDRAEPAWRKDPKGARYIDDEHLDAIIDAIRAFQGDKPGKGFTPEPPPWLLDPPPADPDDDERPTPPVIRPVIQLVGGELPNILDGAEAVLIARDRGVFAFGDQVVRPARRPIRIADDKMTTGLRLVPIAPAHMAERFTKHVDFRRFDKRTEEWVSVDCPRNVAVAYLERIGLWRLPQLSALTTCPLLLPDGRILDKGETMTADRLTVLTSVNRRLASKTFSRGKDGTIKNRSYGSEKHFSVTSIEVTGIQRSALYAGSCGDRAGQIPSSFSNGTSTGICSSCKFLHF